MSSLNQHATQPFTFNRFNAIAFSLGLSIPTSNTIMNLSVAAIVLCGLWKFDFRVVMSLLRDPMVWLPVLIFTMLAISLLVNDHDYGLVMVSKSMKLLYVLPLALFFIKSPTTILSFINGFLSANFIILIISITSWMFSATFWDVDPFNPTIFKLQITQNFFMACTAIIWLSRALTRTGIRRYILGLMVLLSLINIMFAVQGRTGYLALFVGMGSWLLMALPRKFYPGALIGGVILVIGLALVPNRATERVSLGFHEVSNCIEQSTEKACFSSMGLRTAFVRESLRLISQAPFLGNGAGGFFYRNVETGYSVNNPHNEYLLQIVQNGLLGLVLFLSWILCCFLAAWNRPPVCRNQFVALLTSFLACCFFNSFLLDSSEGHFFIVLVAILAGYQPSYLKKQSFKPDSAI